MSLTYTNALRLFAAHREDNLLTDVRRVLLSNASSRRGFNRSPLNSFFRNRKLGGNLFIRIPVRSSTVIIQDTVALEPTVSTHDSHVSHVFSRT